MKPEIRFSGQAMGDIDSIWNYIANQGLNPSAARELMRDFDEALVQASKFPELGQRYYRLRSRNVRKIQVRKRYIIFYQPDRNGIVVLRIRHASELISPIDVLA